MPTKQFGGKITAHWKGIYENSPNWDKGIFNNLEETQTAINWRQIPGILCKQIKGHPQGMPKQNLAMARFQKDEFLETSLESKFVWFGHSALLMRIQGQTICIDPMLGPDASPIAPTKTKRFTANVLDVADEIPDIDLLVISHDHYDHLDLASIIRLLPKIKKAYVALGVKRHLVSWGMRPDVIEEFDWWQYRTHEDMRITFTPTRHFSGRGLTSIARCLWGGWMFETGSEKIWFSGDGGYGQHFKEIGKRFGPIDFAFMECGQYCPDWAQIHLFPRESVQAAIDAGVRKAMPVHWGGFSLSYHHGWNDPADDFVKFAEEIGLPYSTPKIGEVFDSNSKTHFWWVAQTI